MKEKKVQKRYDEEFKRQAVELVIHSGKAQAQIARELGVSEYSLTLWKKDYLGHLKPAQVDGEQMAPEQMLEKIRQLQRENEYLKRQREILTHLSQLAGSTLVETAPGLHRGQKVCPTRAMF